MANSVIAGIRWLKNEQGGNKEPRVECVVASAYATGIFRGDPLKRVDDGTVAVAAAGEAVYAIADGVKQYKAAGIVIKGAYLPVSTTYSGAAILDNPEASVVYATPVLDQQFEIPVDTAQATVVAAQLLVGSNMDLAAGAGGSTATGRSSYVVAAAGTGTGTAQVRLMAISRDPASDPTAANWLGVFKFVEGTEPSPTTATGI